MLKTVLEYYAFFSFICLVTICYEMYHVYFLPQPRSYLEADVYNVHAEMFFYICCFVLLSVLILLNTIRVNRKWRQIVEFDSGIRVKRPKTITSKGMFSLLACVLVMDAAFTVIYFHGFFEMRILPHRWEWLALFCLPTVLCVFLYCGWKISRDDAAFQKTPPRLPNLLPILTGEEKCPKGFRNRINFWGDLTGIGFGMVCMQVFSVGWYFRFRSLPEMPWLGYPTGGASMILIGLSVLAYLVFAIFFAGIPRRRYWGMILLAGTIFVCDAMMICYTKLWQDIHPGEFAMVFGLNAWFLLCFALSGVAGLWVFRKKPLPSEREA